MVNLNINGLDIQVEKGSTVLEAIRFLGFNVPTLCHLEHLNPYGACRLCIVEIEDNGKKDIVTSCTYPAREGLIVRTETKKVVNIRKVLIELLLAKCPSSKVIQDLASHHEVKQVRFKPENADCILCGLCVRICEEQMDGRAIGFVNRGIETKITTPFNMKSEVCRLCGACMWVCPACQLRCAGPDAEGDICGACMNFEPVCIEEYDQMMCYVRECGTCVKPLPIGTKREDK
jgi:NADH dehydrogenase/NADH:ubiquinone oxidoreductase subunit G